MGKEESPTEARARFLLRLSPLMTAFHRVTGQHCGRMVRDVCHRSVLRLSRAWKRRFCRRCWMPLCWGRFVQRRVLGE